MLLSFVVNSVNYVLGVNSSFVQVSTCSSGNIQFVGLDIKIHTCCAIPKDRIQKGSHDCNSSSFFIRSCILLNRKIWRPGMDDHAHISPRINKWLSQCLCNDSGTARLYGQLNICQHGGLKLLLILTCLVDFAGT